LSLETISTTAARQLLLALVQEHRLAMAAQIVGALLMCVPTLVILWRGNLDSPQAIFMLGFSGLFVLGSGIFLFSARRFRKRIAELRCLQQSGIVLAATLVKVGVVGDRAQAMGKPVRFALTLQWQHPADLTVRQFEALAAAPKANPQNHRPYCGLQLAIIVHSSDPRIAPVLMTNAAGRTVDHA
jgi:hypothetical protein